MREQIQEQALRLERPFFCHPDRFRPAHQARDQSALVQPLHGPPVETLQGHAGGIEVEPRERQNRFVNPVCVGVHPLVRAMSLQDARLPVAGAPIIVPRRVIVTLCPADGIGDLSRQGHRIGAVALAPALHLHHQAIEFARASHRDVIVELDDDRPAAPSQRHRDPRLIVDLHRFIVDAPGIGQRRAGRSLTAATPE